MCDGKQHPPLAGSPLACLVALLRLLQGVGAGVGKNRPFFLRHLLCIPSTANLPSGAYLINLGSAWRRPPLDPVLSCALPPGAAPPSVFLPVRHAARVTVPPAASSSVTAVLDPAKAAAPRSLSTPRSRRCGRFSLFDTRLSRRDGLQPSAAAAAAALWPSGFEPLRRVVAGVVACPALPPASFTTMSLRRKAAVPETPRVISPSPTPSEHEGAEYFGPTTRSKGTPAGGATEMRRSRTRSRSPIDSGALARMTPADAKQAPENGTLAPTNGHLAPPQPVAPSGWSWRDFSRSPSPLGLIPIHRHWRTFVHKHEVPRKALHVSIGFFVVWLYMTGTQTSAVPPYLMGALIPIATTDWLRHRYESVNRLYVRLLGALMRESEYSGWNGVIFYLLGAWTVLYFFPKDVGIMSVLLLSWCDTAASTFGRLWGRHTPRLRRGKSLAGSLAAMVVGVATSYFFYGWLVPTVGPMAGDDDFMFKGTLSLPGALCDAVGVSKAAVTITGPLGLGVMSLWSGLVASASEVVDLFGWDDNLTIPVLSGMGMWGFLKLLA